MVTEVSKHLSERIIPFWKKLRDDKYGGYYGFLSYDLELDREAEKGCILNSRILWFFSSAYLLLKDETLLDEAVHAYEFMTKYCIDKENGGIFWSMTYDGKVLDPTKHTYNQAFAIYALSAYYEASGDEEALLLAKELYEIVETKCRDSIGYLEAANERFEKTENDKLSENNVIADRTMNTMLHVLEAYTEFYRVSKEPGAKNAIEEMLTLFADKIYNPKLHRQEVFFDNSYKPIIDLHSYGHDIETTWLVDRAVETIDDEEYNWDKKITPITKDLAENILKNVFDGRSLPNECERGVVDEKRIWWVQAECVVGFVNAYNRSGNTDRKYLEAAERCLDFILEYVVDKRSSSEWFWAVNKDGSPVEGFPIVEPWKCPYHNGRMCIEIIRRLK
ncbi:MAG: AGE family epimerase/isomerase [Lachnospiraceae bacterium]|nr:AGE family epimerase/isomerase [Lachnospiraceae bacterium]